MLVQIKSKECSKGCDYCRKRDNVYECLLPYGEYKEKKTGLIQPGRQGQWVDLCEACRALLAADRHRFTSLAYDWAAALSAHAASRVAPVLTR